MLSAANFAIGLAFIQFSSKLDYGIYMQLFGLLMLSCSIQSAIVSGPMIAMAPKRRARGLQAVSAILFRLQTVVSVLLAIVAFAGVEIAVWGFSVPVLDTDVAVYFALTILTLWVREYVRDYYFLRLNPHATFLVDLCYVCPLTLLLGLGVWVGSFDAAWVLGSMAISNGIAGGVGLWRCRLQPFAAHGRWRKTVWDSWGLSRWTLPGVGLSWLSNFAFVFVVAAVLGAVATAEVSAARLLLMPVALCNTAWLSVITPRISRWVGQRDLTRMRFVFVSSVSGLWGVVAAYSVLLLSLYGALETYVLGEKYAGLQVLVLAWVGYFLAVCLRAAITCWILGAGMFRDALWYNLAAFVVGMPATVLLCVQFGSVGALYGLIVWELVHSFAAWRWGWARLRHQVATP